MSAWLRAVRPDCMSKPPNTMPYSHAHDAPLSFQSSRLLSCQQELVYPITALHAAQNFSACTTPCPPPSSADHSRFLTLCCTGFVTLLALERWGRPPRDRDLRNRLAFIGQSLPPDDPLCHECVLLPTPCRMLKSVNAIGRAPPPPWTAPPRWCRRPWRPPLPPSRPAAGPGTAGHQL